MARRKAVPLRIDPAVYDALARWAADDLVSVNAQIEKLLRESLRSPRRSANPPARQATEKVKWISIRALSRILSRCSPHLGSFNGRLHPATPLKTRQSNLPLNSPITRPCVFVSDGIACTTELIFFNVAAPSNTSRCSRQRTPLGPSGRLHSGGLPSRS